MNEDLQTQVNKLQDQVNHLQMIIDSFVAPDRYVFKRDIELFGARFGRSATESKLAFFGQTPIVQPLSTGESTGAVLTGSTVGHTSTFTGNNGATAYTISDVVKHLKNLGLLKK